jgi:hypothetical protein
MADESRADDLVELGGRQFRLPGWLPSRLPGWPPPRGAAVLAVAALVIGLAVGYTAGDRHARGTAALPKPSATASPSSSAASAPGDTFSFAGSPALTQGTGACSVQTGHELQLGVQVTNQSTAAIELQVAKAVLPMGGLKQVTWQWATCGAIPAGPAQDYDILLPGQSTWLSATFKVQLRCPGFAPVQFTVSYLAQGKPATASLPGFADLGQVPYSGCPPPTSSNLGSPVVARSGCPAPPRMPAAPPGARSSGSFAPRAGPARQDCPEGPTVLLGLLGPTWQPHSVMRRGGAGPAVNFPPVLWRNIHWLDRCLVDGCGNGPALTGSLSQPSGSGRRVGWRGRLPGCGTGLTICPAWLRIATAGADRPEAALVLQAGCCHRGPPQLAKAVMLPGGGRGERPGGRGAAVVGGWPVVALGQAPFTAELRAAVYGRITRSSVTIAVTRSAGVTSKA